MLLIKNGRVIDPASNTDAVLDVLVDGDAHRRGGRGTCGGRMRKILDATGSHRRARIHRSSLPPARAGAGTIRNDRNGNARRGARRIYRRLLHAEYEAGERQCFGDAGNRGARRREVAACECGRSARHRLEARARRSRKSPP